MLRIILDTIYLQWLGEFAVMIFIIKKIWMTAVAFFGILNYFLFYFISCIIIYFILLLFVIERWPYTQSLTSYLVH